MREVEAVPATVRSAFAVLHAVSGAGPAGASVHTVCRATGLHKRSAYRHLRSLRALGMVEAVTEEPGRYRLGTAAAGLGLHASDQRTFLRRARAFADDLTERTREPVHVTVYDHGTAVTVATASGDATRSAEAATIVLGSRRPAHASASGKIFLAYNRIALEAYLTRPLQAFTEHTVVEPSVLHAECKRIRERGWSVDLQENVPGVSCVAVPVWGLHKRVAGSIVVSMRRPELPDTRRTDLLNELVPAGAEFSRAIGGEAQ